MAKVHDFALDNELFSDTRVPFQYRGGSKTNTRRAFELSALVDFVAANMDVALSVQSTTVSAGTPEAQAVDIAANRLVLGVLVTGAAPGTFNLGTSPGGSDILGGEAYGTTSLFYFVPRFYPASGSLCFDGFSGTLSLKIILINLS